MLCFSFTNSKWHKIRKNFTFTLIQVMSITLHAYIHSEFKERELSGLFKLSKVKLAVNHNR